MASAEPPAAAAAPDGAGAVDGGGGDGDVLLGAVEAALGLAAEEREVAVPFAVQCVLQDSADRVEAARMLSVALSNARGRLPSSAAPLLDRLAAELTGEAAQERGAASTAVSSSKCTAEDGSKATRGDVDSDDGDEEGESEGMPFCLGPHHLPLVVLLNIANGLEPDDLTPAAGACKSLCIAININLQYVLFLVRLLRLIVLGPELARQLRDNEGSDGDTTSTDDGSSDDG